MIPKGGTENAAKETNHILGDIARIKKNIQENPEKESFSRQLLEAVEKLKIAREKEINQNRCVVFFYFYCYHYYFL